MDRPTVSRLQENVEFPLFAHLTSPDVSESPIFTGSGRKHPDFIRFCKLDRAQRSLSIIERERLTDDGLHRVDLAYTYLDPDHPGP